MEQTPGMEDALLIAVSDHGQEDIQKTVNLTAALERIGLSRRLLVQSNGMSAYFFPGPDGTGNIGGLIRSLTLHAEELGISRVYTRSDMDAMHAVAGPILGAEAAPGVVFSDSLDEEKREKATHGFGPGRAADRCLFAVRGRGIRKNTELDPMPMRDVGPTIAGLMGLELPRPDGMNRSALFLE